MNQRQRFVRKIVYATVIAALLLPLSWLSQPETTETTGGVLARMRAANQLSQAQLGDIDPASETIKLATLGMRGVAANILWTKANNYKKTEDWTGYSAALEQIAKLQPNVVSVWIFLGWNLTHNVSVEFDDYRDRYYWVIKGINYRQEGTKYNRNSPKLLSDIGWTIAQKIGRADERVQFRRLFREDDDFNGSRPLAQRDNWLVGREWLLTAEQAAAQGVAVRGERPSLFHSHPVMCLVNYAEDLEEEGTFGEVAKNAWRKAADAWEEFSSRDLPTLSNVFIRLGDKEAQDEESRKAQEVLAQYTPPGLREQLHEEKLALLTQAEREAYQTAAADRTSDQQSLMPEIDRKLEIYHLEVADRITGEHRAEALRAAEEATQADMISNLIAIERDVVYYPYWRLRCQIEPRDETLEARRLVYEGDQAFRAAELVKSRDLYAQGLARWRSVLDEFPLLLTDPNTTDPLIDSINRYRNVLHQLDEKFPDPFVLQAVIDADIAMHGDRDAARRAAAGQTQPAAEGEQESPQTPAAAPQADPETKSEAAPPAAAEGTPAPSQ